MGVPIFVSDSQSFSAKNRTDVTEERLKDNVAMGISISVLMASDDQIRDFIAQPSRLEDLLNSTIPYTTEDCCYLANCWHGLHYLLTGEITGGDLPLCALRRGEVTFAGLSDPTHAIYSKTAEAFAGELSKLSEAILRKRFDPLKVPGPGRGGRPILPAPGEDRYRELLLNSAEGTFRELLTYFSGLRDFSLRAAEKNMGLLFCRYEDW